MLTGFILRWKGNSNSQPVFLTDSVKHFCVAHYILMQRQMKIRFPSLMIFKERSPISYQYAEVEVNICFILY